MISVNGERERERERETDRQTDTRYSIDQMKKSGIKTKVRAKGVFQSLFQFL